MRAQRRWMALAAVVAMMGLAAGLVAEHRDLARRLGSADARTVVTAYFQAQRLGFESLARTIDSDDVRLRRAAPNLVEGWVNDVLAAGALEVAGPDEVRLRGEFAEEVQFVVTYSSRWPNAIGQPPGPRLWFVYMGRDRGGPWRFLGQGTGP